MYSAIVGGLLDVSGAALLLSERAGRSQAVRHLKARLEQEKSRDVREALAASLRRHAHPDDNLADWWWQRRELSWAWLKTAGQLGLLGDLTSQRTSDLTEILRSVASETAWATAALQQGNYNGTDDEVLTVVRDEINDGACDTLPGDRTTPIGRLIEGAAVAQLRPSRTGAGEQSSGLSTTRTRLRRKARGGLIAEMVAATDELRRHPGASANDQEWQARLIRVTEAWGNGWVLRRAVAAVPIGVGLGAIAHSVKSTHPELASVLTLEAEVRDNRGSSDWWRRRLAVTEDGLESRHWIFSLLACAHQAVLIDLAGELNKLVDALAPKHFQAIREGLKTFSRLSVARALLLRDPLRLNQVELSPRVLWLARVVVSEGSVEPIDKRLMEQFTALLQPGTGDLRELVRIAGKSRTIKSGLLRGSRPVLPVGGWASNIKLGAMRANVPDDVLRARADWPGDLVQRAAQQVEGRMTVGAESIASVATVDDWFQQD